MAYLPYHQHNAHLTDCSPNGLRESSPRSPESCSKIHPNTSPFRHPPCRRIPKRRNSSLLGRRSNWRKSRSCWWEPLPMHCGRGGWIVLRGRYRLRCFLTALVPWNERWDNGVGEGGELEKIASARKLPLSLLWRRGVLREGGRVKVEERGVYLAIGVDDGQERDNLKGHVGLVHSPVLIV